MFLCKSIVERAHNHSFSFAFLSFFLVASRVLSIEDECDSDSASHGLMHPPYDYSRTLQPIAVNWLQQRHARARADTTRSPAETIPIGMNKS